MKRLYIKSDPSKLVSEIKKRDCEGFEATLLWADELKSGFITHRAHYEMERSTTRVPFSDRMWSEVPKEAGTDDPEWIYALARHSNLWCLAKAYSYSEDPEYISCFEKIISSFLMYTEYSNAFTETSWRSLETGIRPENWIRSLELFNAMGLELMVVDKMKESLKDHIRQLMETRRSFHRLSNWGIIQDHGLFVAGLYLGDSEAVETSLERLEEELSLSILPDGNHFEQSPLYHAEVLHCLLDTILVARNTNTPLCNMFEKKASAMAEALYLQKSTAGKLFLQGDSDEITIDDLLFSAGMLLERKDFLEKETEETLWDFGPYDGELSPHVYKSAYLEYSGNIYLRGKNIETRFFSGQMGSGHGNISPLHVDVLYRGTPFATDSGRLTYMETDDRLLLRSAEAHNVLILDGSFPDKPIGTWSFSSLPEIQKGSVLLHDEFDLAEASHLSYLDNGTVIRRRVLRLGDNILIIADDILSSNDHSSEVLWHFHPNVDLQRTDNHSLLLKSGETTLLLWHSQEISDTSTCVISPRYNEKLEGTVLRLSEDTHGKETLISVFCGDTKAAISISPVSFLGSGRTVPGKGLSVSTDKERWNVILRPSEANGPVDPITDGCIVGYGRVFLKKDSWRHAQTIIA